MGAERPQRDRSQMNRLPLLLALPVLVGLGCWYAAQRSRDAEDERLVQALAHALQVAQQQVNPAFVEFHRHHRRGPNGNAEAGLPPPDGWQSAGYDRVQLYSSGDVRFEFHGEGQVQHAFVWRSPSVAGPGEVYCAVRGIPIRVLRSLRLQCNVEIDLDPAQASTALPPIPRSPPKPSDLVLEAVSRDDVQALTQLRDGGTSLCEADSMGRLALAEAARGNQPKSLDLLLQSGCPVDALEPATGRSALMVVSALHDLHTAELLLRSGANPTLANAQGESAWFLLGTSGYAVPGADLRMRELMLERGAAADQADAQGQTMLMLAASAGAGDLAQWLLAHGARLEQADAAGRTALMHAVVAPQGERALPVFLERGASFKAADRNGNTAETLASQIDDPARRRRVLWTLSHR